MGILAMNIVAFAMPFQAYMNPTAYGMESGADLGSWLVSFIFIDGKMRGLFSFLFGASTLLVIERAEASGESPARVHYARMFWLLVFGLLHFYFIWFGDILAALRADRPASCSSSATCRCARWSSGASAWCSCNALLFGGARRARALPQPGGRAPCRAELAEGWRTMQEGFAPLTGPDLADKLALFRGAYAGPGPRPADRARMLQPFTGTWSFWRKRLAYMLLGMAALKSGFFRGEWDDGALPQMGA